MRIRHVAGVLWGLASGPLLATDATSLAAVTDCMRGNIPPTVRVQSFDLRTVDRGGGERILRGRLHAAREDDRMRANLRIDAPADLRDAAYLMRETADGRDDMFVYLPALNKVRRILGGTRENPLFGTDFSYNDLRHMQNAFEGANGRLLPAETVDGRPVHVMEMRELDTEAERYTHLQAWVDQESCVALKVEFHDADGVVKRLISPAASLARAGEYWYAGETTMFDLRAGSYTDLTITGVTSGENIAGRLFNPSLFYLGN